MNGTILAIGGNISLGRGDVVTGGLFGGSSTISAGPSTLVTRAGFVGGLP